MAVRDDRGDVKQTTTGFRGPLMVQSLTSAKSKFLSLNLLQCPTYFKELQLTLRTQWFIDCLRPIAIQIQILMYGDGSV